MREPFFWEATALHYFSIIMAIGFNSPVFGAMSLITCVLIPGLTQAELIPGIRESMKAQAEVLRTQTYLNKEGYYENVQ